MTDINYDEEVEVADEEVIENPLIAVKETQDLEPKTEIHVLYKKCLKCGWFVPWVDKVYDCNEDVECPGGENTKFDFTKGRDPKKLINTTASAFALAIVQNKDKEFLKVLGKMAKKESGNKEYIFDSMVSAFKIIKTWEQEASDEEVAM